MTPKQVIKHYGSVAHVAAALGYTSQAVQAWLRKGRISAMSQRYIEAATNGVLLADRGISLRDSRANQA